MPHAQPPGGRRSIPVTLTLLVACALFALLTPTPAHATFHLIEITKIMAGFEGDDAIEAVEMTMLADGQHHVAGTSLRVYNASGVLVATLGTFGADLPATGGFAGRKVLFATMKFRQRFGITPDLQINAGIPHTTGQVSFEIAGCLVNAIAYGGVTTFMNGPSAGPPLPIAGATSVDRGINGNATFPSCPLGENAGARFALYQGYAGHPIRFTNNAGTFVDVISGATGVEPTAQAPRPLRASPNPFQHATDIEFLGGARQVLVHDVHGRLIRSWDGSHGTRVAEASRILTWDGTDEHGRLAPSGIYFVRAVGERSTTGERPLRIVLLR